MTKRTAPGETRRSPGQDRRFRSTAWRRLAGVLGGSVFAATVLASSREANAQAWLQDRRTSEGAGIRVGDLELHPGIGGEVGYDSNWFRRTFREAPAGLVYVNGAPLAPPVEAAVLRITPSLTLSTLGSQRLGENAPKPRVAFQGGISGSYFEFLGSDNIAANTDIRSQRNFSLNASARLDVNPGRPLGFGVFGTFARQIQPSAVADPNLSFNRDNVTAGAEVVALPGGGTFDIRAGYEFLGSFYEQSNGTPYTSYIHQISVRDRWKFRPRTALFQETSIQFVSYPNAQRAVYSLNGMTPLMTRVGITGLVTERFSTLLAGGYSGTFFERSELASTRQYDSFNAQAEGTFFLSQGGAGEPGQASLLLSTLSLGYVRNFQRSLLGNFYTSNRGYAKVVYFFGGTTLLQLDGYFEGQSYPQPYYNDPATGAPVAINGVNGAPTGDFTNYRVGGTLFGEYRFSNSFGINATFDYSQTMSDTLLAATRGPNPTNEFYDLAWRRFQAMLGVRWFL